MKSTSSSSAVLVAAAAKQMMVHWKSKDDDMGTYWVPATPEYKWRGSVPPFSSLATLLQWRRLQGFRSGPPFIVQGIASASFPIGCGIDCGGESVVSSKPGRRSFVSSI
ncbi:hypothetical protein LINPERHAP1_LOCUS7307 [Linum perenne]